MKDKHELDQLFKTGLGDPDIPFNEKHWEDMLGKLEAERKKGVLPMWLYTACSIAAVLLILLFWVFSDTAGLDDKNKNAQVKSKQADVIIKKIEDLDEVHDVIKQVPTNRLPLAGKRIPAVGIRLLKEEISTEHLVASNGKYSDIRELAGLATDVYVLPVIQENLMPFSTPEDENHIKDRSFVKPGPLVLSVIAAPDITRGASSTPSKLSSNFGLLATYSLTRKLSITSGIIYARKFYNYRGLAAAGSTYAGNAWEVNADCKVLDIPLNVNYQVFKKNRFAVSLNSGVSSYLMLNEKYKYINGQPGDQKISVREIKNENQHIFGVANLSVNFEQKINRSMSIGVQPFAKLPLTGIGYGDANLKSTGVSFSLNFGL